MAKDSVATRDQVAFDMAIPARLREIIDANLGGEIRPQDLPKVTMPRGGALSWEVPTLEGMATTPALVGVVLHTLKTRAYWPGKIGEGSPFPVCSSADAVTGVGTPGGACQVCPHAQFTAGPDGSPRRQACREFRILLLAQPSRTIPLVVRLAPASIKVWDRYQSLLASFNVATYEAVTRLALEHMSNDGLEYAVVAPSMEASLDEESRAEARRSHEILRQALSLGRYMAETTDDGEAF